MVLETLETPRPEIYPLGLVAELTKYQATWQKQECDTIQQMLQVLLSHDRKQTKYGHRRPEICLDGSLRVNAAA